MQTIPHRFQPRDLVAGDVVLDLMNTVTAWNSVPIDWLDEYERLLAWTRLTGEFEAGTLRELSRLSERDPATAERSLRRLRRLRVLLRDIVVALIEHDGVPERTLRRYEGLVKDAVAHSSVTESRGGLELGLTVASSGLRYIEHALVLRSLTLFRGLDLDRTRICAGDRCGWIFVDRSKGGRRRWCDMATCGNAAKGRRHYQRTRRTRTPNTG
jgi:predicted RNA-binding Zn ribbon-like protein